MTAALFDPIASPTLGRLQGFEKRYVLRDEDEEVEWPTGCAFPVLDEAGLVEPILTNREALLVATEAGRALLDAAGMKPLGEAKAGKTKVFVYRPRSSIDCDTGGESEDEDTGYGRLATAAALSVDLDELSAAVVAVDETRLLAFNAGLGAALREAGLTRGLLEQPAPYAPPQPEGAWYIVAGERGRKVAQFESLSLEGAGSDQLPEHHPLVDFIRVDGQPVDRPTRYWGGDLDPKKLMDQLYVSGAPLPQLTLTQAKPKADKKIHDVACSGYLILSPAARAVVEKLGIEGDQAPVRFLDTTGAPMKQQSHVLFRAASRPLVDWASSDVNWTRSHTIWGFRELALDPEACEAAPPLVHIRGTRLHLANQAFVDACSELLGFEFIPVSNYTFAYNLDDEYTNWRI